ncbi:Bystin [Tritrichomonas foetus]|uniref:Bystin n=1 Tax=Tritrichomonas foetus TaxID=1144522 RepID=A0A1J4JJE3_9EUKA|nr:Bystin [Tritrichomonas foetus]|eukprot:OHS97651.1 Bystin [Tritrichomonas foetus]
MSTKKIHLDKAPAHGQSLAEEEIESRSNLVAPKASRQKKKEVEDPRLGADMTEKILRSAVNQIVEEEAAEKGLNENIEINVPSDDEDVEDGEIEFELETNDEESRNLFELFKGSISHMARHFDHELAKTRHQVDPKVREVYTQLGSVLKIYKSGKLPKAVNVVASQKIPDWEDLLELSNPMNWSLNAVQAVTLLFAQSASDKRLTTYIRHFLLDYIQELLERSKKLPKQIWNALMAAARRPPCFINGMLIPLSMEPQVSMKEARVISAIVTKVKLPRDHMNAFIIKICEAENSATRTIFLARLISKGQALAIRTIDSILSYFLSFLGEDEKQPLIWQKALLDFIKRYGQELTYEQREALEPLLQKQHHQQITPEIRSILEKVPPREENGESMEEIVPVL